MLLYLPFILSQTLFRLLILLPNFLDGSFLQLKLSYMSNCLDLIIIHYNLLCLAHPDSPETSLDLSGDLIATSLQLCSPRGEIAIAPLVYVLAKQANLETLDSIGEHDNGVLTDVQQQKDDEEED